MAGQSSESSTMIASTSGGVRFFKIGFAPRQLLQRQFAAGVVKLLEAIEAVARVAHHFAGLADIAELPRQLQQPYLGADDRLSTWSSSVSLSKRRGRALRTPTTPRPASASASAMTPTVRLSLNYCTSSSQRLFRHSGQAVYLIGRPPRALNTRFSPTSQKTQGCCLIGQSPSERHFRGAGGSGFQSSGKPYLFRKTSWYSRPVQIAKLVVHCPNAFDCSSL